MANTTLRKSLTTSLLSLCLFLTGQSETRSAEPLSPQFRIKLDESLARQAAGKRGYVFCAPEQEPRKGPNWFKPAPMLSFTIPDSLPENELTVGFSIEAGSLPAGHLQYPATLASGALQGLNAQAVIRLNPHQREVGNGPGNAFSLPVVIRTDAGRVTLLINQIVPELTLADSEWTKVLHVPSKKLSDFHNRPVKLSGAVRLPPSYHSQPERRYPVIFEVPGFGGEISMAVNKPAYAPETAGGVEFIHVFLDPNCGLGHHVFADSANNGPVGAALIHEFIPEFDRQFRSTGQPTGRFLTGHSSGGWSSLWLQVTYPEVFNGVWSTAPDPVDFRDFQGANLYRAGEQMYVDRMGNRRPLARRGTEPFLWYNEFTHMEDVLGLGGQMRSFDAVFSNKGADGTPLAMWDHATGLVNADVAQSWKKYDISLILKENWQTLGPKLSGKLNVFMGDLDTFYLEGATILLKENLKSLGSDAVVEIHPGANHSSLMTPALRARIPREMSERFLKTTEQK